MSANAFDWKQYTTEERQRQGIKNPYRDMQLSVINSHIGASDRMKTIKLRGTKIDLRPKQFIVYSKARSKE